MIIEVFLVAALLLALIVKKFSESKKENLPPGPFQWPILGNTVDLLRAHPTLPYLAYDILAKKHGNLMSLKIGVHDAVVVSSYEDIKYIFSHENFVDRYKFSFIKARSFNKELGIIFSNGEFHHEVRNFTIKNLSDFGFGKSHSMEAILAEQLEDVVSRLKTKVLENDGRVEMNNRTFALSSVNLIWSLLTGDRIRLTDEKLEAVFQLCERFNDTVKLDNVTIPYPILGTLFPQWSGWASHLKTYSELYAFIENQIDERVVNTEDPQTFLDVFRREILRNQGNENTPFTKEQMVLVVWDLFIGGSETTGNTISYFLLYVTLAPRVQEKLHKEIDDIISKRSMPSVDDIKRMPYVQAAIAETMRLSNTVPQVGLRMASEDFVYKGYKIRKGTAMINNSHSFLMDKTYWVDPEEFRPERFIDDNGNFKSNERVLVFGFGNKRICPGEHLARTTLFMYFVTLLQKFTFEVDPEAPLPSIEPRPLFTLGPYPFKVKISVRD